MQAHLIKDARQKIMVGNLSVYLILAVSLGASIAYWYILSGAGSSHNTSLFWQTIIWLIVAVGMVAELIKKLTISLFRNKAIWLVSTLVSVLTVMGTYSILDNDKQNQLIKQSDSYQMAKGQKENALKKQSQYAYAKNFSIEVLEKKKRIAGNKHYWGAFNQAKKDIEAKRQYDSAVNTLRLSNNNMENSDAGNASSNPLLSNIANIMGISPNLLKTIFYLIVTLLLEVAAFWIGGEVGKLQNRLKLTEAEILDLKIRSTFGFSVKEINPVLFSNVVTAETERVQAEKQIEKLRKTNRKKLPASETVTEVKRIRKQVKEKEEQAKLNHSPAPTSQHSFSFGFVPNNEPKQVQSEPKRVQNSEPKQVQKQPLKPDIKPIRKGSTRKTVTPDTGITGATANRYRALKKAVIKGEVRPTKRGIKGFKFGGRGMGDLTAKKYREALIKEGIIS